jgi:16S rRNA (uracil1498-N3)-methyltransferase
MHIPNSKRFFVTESLGGATVTLADPALVHQIGAVLRLRPGDAVLLLDGGGDEVIVRLDAVERKLVTGTVESRRAGAAEPRTRVTLYVALLRGERFEWVLQKATELGAAAFVPVQFRHSLADRADEKKLERWRRIIREAAEQSCRALLPPLSAPVSFNQACAAAGPGLLLYEGAAPPLRDALGAARPVALSLFTGPEGGIAEEELTTAERHGIMSVSLGPRILRAETAPIAALSAVLYHHGDL